MARIALKKLGSEIVKLNPSMAKLVNFQKQRRKGAVSKQIVLFINPLPDLIITLLEIETLIVNLVKILQKIILITL